MSDSMFWVWLGIGTLALLVTAWASEKWREWRERQSAIQELYERVHGWKEGRAAYSPEYLARIYGGTGDREINK